MMTHNRMQTIEIFIKRISLSWGTLRCFRQQMVYITLNGRKTDELKVILKEAVAV